MARKTMPAARKRPASVQQEPETSAAAPAEVDPSSVSSLPSARTPSPPDGPSFPLPSPHVHDYKRRAHGEIPHMRKWLHACKHIKRLIEDMCKVLSTAGSSHEGNAQAAAYASPCNLLLGAKVTSIQDLLGSLTDLSMRMDNVWPRVNPANCTSHCVDDINCKNASESWSAFNEQNLIQSKALTNPKDFYMLTSLQLEAMKNTFCQSRTAMEERSISEMGLLGQHSALRTLLSALLNSSGSSCKRKKSWVGNVSWKASNIVRPSIKGVFMNQKDCSGKCSKHRKVQIQSVLGGDKEKPADLDLQLTHQMSTGELESWIVKHSMPSKKRELEIAWKPRTPEKTDEVCLEMGGENHIEIEVDLSKRGGFWLKNEAAATDGVSNTHHVKHIMKTVSLSRVNLDGHDEVIVLFKALRSDGKEIIVDNTYLRSTSPLLVSFVSLLI